MTRQNKVLLAIISMLLAINVTLMVTKNSGGSLGFDDAMFAVQDTASIASIKMGEVELVRSQGKWMIGKYPADPAFVDHLLNVLMRVRVKKPVGSMDGIMTIEVDGRSFSFAPNETKTKTYFVKDGQGYEMEIPGFTDYLGGILELNPDQWRDRLVYNGSWRTIQKLEMDYVGGDDQDFTITFDKNFFKVGGVDAIDTMQLMNYLNQFQYFQANERISEGRVPEMDSIFRTEPIAILTFDDINYQDEVVLKIFDRRPEDQFHLVTDPNGEMIAVDAPRMNQMLRSKSDFQAKN